MRRRVASATPAEPPRRPPRRSWARAPALALLSLTLTLAGLAAAAPRANPWGEIKTPAPGPPRAIGDYSGGCVQGAKALAMDGPGFQVMHPSRLRYYGHPHLVSFIETLGHAMAEQGQADLLIGDLGQPRGGRATGGHASHQSGLDVDIWFWHPPRAAKGKLSNADREHLKSRSVLNGKTRSIRAKWKARVAAVLELTGRHPQVERVFVHPIIKRELCATAGEDRAWLRAIRPWYGHDDHFHVRLACPADSPECEPQDAVPPGDGCDALDWWFDAEAQAERKRERSRYRRKVVSARRWPEACDALLPPEKAK